MKNVIEEYIPFEHKDIEYINGSLNLARRQRGENKTLESTMASAVIYTNLVEYLATNLFHNLEHMVFLKTYKDFHAIFFVKAKDNRVRTPLTLGQLSQALCRYEFPDRQAFIELLDRFAKLRNAIFHRLLQISSLEAAKVDEQFTELHQLAEEVVDKYNRITTGITTIWFEVNGHSKKQS